MKFYLLIAIVMIPFFGSSQWTRTELRAQKVKKSQEKLEYAALYYLDAYQLRILLKDVPERFSGSKGVIIFLPTALGKIEKFQVWESSNMDPELQKKYPDIKSYVGTSLNDPSVYLRFSLSPVGFSSMITRSGLSEFIEPYSEDRTVYAVFDSKAKRGQEKEYFECTTPEKPGVKNSGKKNEAASKKTAGFNVFRLAITCTGEYAEYHLNAAGTPATATEAQKKAVILAAINASLTRLNAVFEKDLSLHFNLVANNDAVIYVDTANDPYDPLDEQDTQAQTAITNIIGSANYDMGHIFDKENANGYAPGDICIDNTKSRGWTASNFPEGDTFDIDYVAHEMGHQLGANHSYSVSLNGSGATEVEPGSGTTIMAYTGIIGGSYDVQFNSDDYFHTVNVAEIKTKINTVACGANTPFANPAPVVNAGLDYTIPKSTPFVLKASTTDANAASYTYIWEQMDLAGNSDTGANSIAFLTKSAGPNFRSLMPVSVPGRYFPDFNKVLAGVLTTRWESVSSVARSLNFTVTLRTNNPVDPQTSKDAMVVTVDAATGPFQVTSPIFGQSLASGGAFNVTWDVAATNAAPISTANVNIKLSTDGGQTFTTIAANTPNDGSEQITVPAGSSSTNAFIMIEAVGNIYYAVSPSFVIDYAVNDEACTTYTYSGSPVAITDGPGGGSVSAPIVKAPLMVNNTGTITRVKVTPSITHPNIRHLAVGIQSPVGSSALIWSRSCSNSSGITASFSDTGNAVVCASPVQGETKSFESLAIFKGHKAQGEWKLFATDNSLGSIGTITGWSLEVCTQRTQLLGTKEISSPGADDIKIYPNPSDGKFFIKSRNFNGEMKVTLFDTAGRLISSDFYQSNGDHTKEFNLNVSKGVYMININSPKGVYNQKLIIK
ncbi:reprolysin-like metallopeptidase [Chryseobacterium herbae]|uniref:M12 family metallo-peptidase n=1 Tax=Chryseobacterium herbae TaxID=2976476 RepID=A0ABT2IPN4_9FLAO|nr:zinc-dependent metalloprotease family protein [Chryseobacterium sp. pc1-10]MCT2560783.1 M12 family metallo-peptidase [Chryseobacterium sp. pc1-10]